MTDANEMYDAIMRELKGVVIFDSEETKDEQESFLFHEEEDLEDIPPSLLSYFEASKNRAEVFEKFILEGHEDFTGSHHTEDVMKLPIEPDEDMMKVNDQVIGDTENEENNTSTDTRLLPAPTETEALLTHNVSVCPNNEDEAGADEYTESERHSAFEVRTVDISLNEEERKKSGEYEAEREKRHCEEMKKEEQKRQIERDFQEELRKIMEAEKLRQKELELMEKRAQEKLEAEFLLQQELINSLQRQVEEERRLREEEQKRMKDEEDKRKKEEEKIRIEAERKRLEEEEKIKMEAERKRLEEEEKIKMEAERKRMEEEEKIKMEAEKKRMEEEEKVKKEAARKRKEEEEKVRIEAERKRKEEEEKIRIEAERKRMEEEEKVKKEAVRKRREEEEKVKKEAVRKRKEEEEKIRIEAERKRMEEKERIKIEAERKRLEEETRKKKEEEGKIEEMKLKKEEVRKNEEEKKTRLEREEKRKRELERNKIDLEKKKLEEEMRMMKEEEEGMKKEEVERIKREEERKKMEEARKKMEKEMRKMEEQMCLKKVEECQKKDKKERKRREEKDMRIEEERRVTKVIEERKKREETRKKKEEDIKVDDRKKMAQEKMKKDKRDGNVDEEIKHEETKKKEEKGKKKIEEKTLEPIDENEKRKKEDEGKAKEEEWKMRQKEKMRRQRDEEDHRKEMRLKEDEEGYEGYDVNKIKMDHENKSKDEENKLEDERKNVEVEKEQNGEDVGENKKEVNNKTEEEMRLKEKEESKKKTVQDEDEVRTNEVQEEREHNSLIGQNEKNNMDKTGNSLASQLEDSTAWIPSSPVPLHSESPNCPTSAEAKPQKHDLDMNISLTSKEQTVDCENQAARPPTESVSLPVCLPEHTEHKRLAWMKDCIPWSKLSLQSRRKQAGTVRSRRGPRRAAEASSLPPLCPDSLLQSTGWKSLQEVTTVTLEDLPGCSLSTLAQCTQLRSLSVRRCGLKSLEGINQLPHLVYIDVQENDISFVDCENMTSLRVLQISHNKLTSIHGLTGAENLDVLDISHNSITRIAGLESVRRLQRLSVDHNQLISTKGLRNVYTLLHLNCSHNHLASVEGLESSTLLNTVDLRANSLTEPPSLNNQVLLRELHLDDNSISSLQGLAACWLPLMQHLSVAQNRITQLPSMSDFVSLTNLDLRFNCMSELQNVCESLDGCQFLQEVHLTGNPLQQESGWRSTLQKAVPGLRAINELETDSSLSPPAVQRVSLASGSFLTFCQAQLQQTRDLQQQHARELSNASSSLDAVQTSCRHFTEALQLAADQRFAHEYGDTTVDNRCRAAGQTTEETPAMDSNNAEEHSEHPEMESTGEVPPVIPNRDNIRCSHWTFDEKSAAESQHDTFNSVSTGLKRGLPASKADAGSAHSLATKRKIIPNLGMAPESNHQDLDLQNTAAVVIQQLWRKYREKCGNISSPSTAERGGGRGGGGGKPESRPSHINGSVVGKDYAATVIQAFWRGFTLRRRLTSALVAVTCPDTGEDDTFEEVDVDEFVFDEAAVEKNWVLPFSEDSPPRRYPVLEQPLPLEPPGPFPEPSQYILPPPLPWRSKQAWVAGEQADSAGQRVSPLSSNRSKSPVAASADSGLSERPEKIVEEWGFTHSHTALLMLKRAQNMKSKKQQQKKRQDPSVRLALFRNCSNQMGPVEARNRQAQHNRNYRKVREAEPGPQRAGKTERVKQEQAQQWLLTQAAPSDRDSESVHFLPEISSDILNGGRVQLVCVQADPGYTERLHHASGLWANSSLAAQPCKENSYPRRNSLGHAKEELPSPQRVTSAPSKKEHISFRDNPVQLSGGWGGGKRRGKVCK